MEADEIPSIDERLRRRQRDDDDDRHRELSTLFNPYTPGIEDDLDACQIGGKSRREVVADLQEEYNYHRKREDSLGNYTGYCGLSVDDRTVLVRGTTPLGLLRGRARQPFLVELRRPLDFSLFFAVSHPRPFVSILSRLH